MVLGLALLGCPAMGIQEGWECSGDDEGCGDGEVCRSFEGGMPKCYTVCDDPWDCPAGEGCSEGDPADVCLPYSAPCEDHAGCWTGFFCSESSAQCVKCNNNGRATDCRGPAAPGDVSAVAGDAAVTITWTQVPDAEGYDLYWSTTGAVNPASQRIAGVESPYIHTDRATGTTYYYAVMAYNSEGNSALSTVVSAALLFPIGSECDEPAQCESTECIDRVCCESRCSGACEACSATLTGGANGSCLPIPSGQDPDLECSDARGCNGARACVTGAVNGVACGQDNQCTSGHCVDRVCCDSACAGTCEACRSDLNSEAAVDGTCGLIPYLKDPEDECAGGFGCRGDGACSPVKTWQTPVLIETDNAGDAGGPVVAMNDSGHAYAAWTQNDGTPRGNKVWANRLVPGSGWGSAVRIERHDGNARFGLDVAIDAQGNALAVWSQGLPSGFPDLWGNRCVASTGLWGTPTLMETSEYAATYPNLSMNDAGVGLAVWSRFTANGVIKDVWGSKYEPGVGWETAVLLENGAGDAAGAVIALNSSGDGTMVWGQRPDSNEPHGDIFVRDYSNSAGWGPIELLESSDTESAGAARVVLDDEGNATATWIHEVPDWQPWARRRPAGGVWGVAVPLDSPDAGHAYLPEIALMPGGGAVVAWRRYSGGHANVVASIFRPESGWSTPALLEDGSGDANPPRIDADSLGNIVVVWTQASAGGRYDLWFVRYVRGAGWISPALVETNDSGDVTDVALSNNSDGGAVAVWVQLDDAARANVWASVFE